MSNMLVLDLFNSMRAGRSSSDDYEDDYQVLVPTMTTIKPAYRWAIRGVVVTIAIVVSIGNITAEKDLSLKIVSVVGMILAAWFAFGITADGLAYRIQQGPGIPQESMV